MKRIFLITAMALLLVGMQVSAAKRVVVAVDVLSEGRANVALQWSDGSDASDLMISGWRFDDEVLTLSYQAGVGGGNFNSRIVTHETGGFPMPVLLEEGGQQKPVFGDVEASGAKGTAILNLYYRGIISGYPDGSFKGTNPVRRSEFAKMLMTTAHYATITGQASSFQDVPDNHWAKDYIMTLSAKGIVNGKSDGRFDPQGEIKVGEVLAVMTRTFELYGNKPSYPHFLPNHWSNTYFLQGVEQGIVTKEDDIYSNYDANAPATREFCAVLLSRVLENLHDVKG